MNENSMFWNLDTYNVDLFSASVCLIKVKIEFSKKTREEPKKLKRQVYFK